MKTAIVIFMFFCAFCALIVMCCCRISGRISREEEKGEGHDGN